MFRRAFILTALAALGLYIINFKTNVEDYGKVVFSIGYLIMMFIINSIPMSLTQSRIVRYYFELKQYEKAEAYLNKKMSNIFFSTIIRHTRINLMFTYIYLDRIDEAKQIVKKMRNKKYSAWVQQIATIGAELVIREESGQKIETTFNKFTNKMQKASTFKKNVFKTAFTCIEHYRLTRIVNYIMSNEKSDYDRYFMEENINKWPIFKRIVEKENVSKEVSHDNN